MKRSLTIYFAVPLMLFMIVGIEYAQSAYTQELLREERDERMLKFQLARAQLESVIFHDIYLSESLATYIAANPESSIDEWQPIARALFERADAIRNIGVAPNDILRFIYPIEGNEAALGYDLRTNPDQYEPLIHARETREMVISGPVELVQGGRAIIARVPIFELENPDQYWGLTSVVLNNNILSQRTGLRTLEAEGIRFAMRGLNGTGRNGPIFYGPEELFDGNHPELVVNIPNGSWVLAFEQVNEFSEGIAWYRSQLVRIIGITVMIAFLAILAYSNWALKIARHHSRIDPLTGSANLRFLTEFADMLIAKHAKGANDKGIFGVLYIDLDGFKQINDVYGHNAGDEVLMKVASVLTGAVASSDMIARIGGDEFLILLNRVRDERALESVARRVREAIEGCRVHFGEHELSIGASIGGAIFPMQGRNLDSLLKVADEKMYEDKRQRKASKS